MYRYFGVMIQASASQLKDLFSILRRARPRRL